MKKRYKILALIGRSGAGKDTIKKFLLQAFPNELSSIVQFTTRPPRQGEKDGVEYFFITPDKFVNKLMNGTMIEATNFNNWVYGTSIGSLSLDKINVGIFNPTGIECLYECPEVDITTVEIKLSNEKEYLIRCLSREDNPDCLEICRRYKEDLKDFSLIDFPIKEYYNDDAPIKSFWENLIMELQQDKNK